MRGFFFFNLTCFEKSNPKLSINKISTPSFSRFPRHGGHNFEINGRALEEVRRFSVDHCFRSMSTLRCPWSVCPRRCVRLGVAYFMEQKADLCCLRAPVGGAGPSRHRESEPRGIWPPDVPACRLSCQALWRGLRSVSCVTRSLRDI